MTTRRRRRFEDPGQELPLASHQLKNNSVRDIPAMPFGRRPPPHHLWMLKVHLDEEKYGALARMQQGGVKCSLRRRLVTTGGHPGRG